MDSVGWLPGMEHFIKDSSRTANMKEKAYYNIQTAIFTRVISMEIHLKDKDNYNLRRKINIEMGFLRMDLMKKIHENV